MKPLLFYFLVLGLFITKSVKAQTLFEDGRGETSINLPIGGITRLNTTDESLKIGYYYNRSDKDVVFGLDASGKSNNGFAALLSDKKLSPEADINFNVGFKNVSTNDMNPGGYDYLNIKVGIGRAQYWLLNANAAYDNQIYSKSFTKFNAGISYNYLLNGNMIFGGYAGYNRTNNISSLPQITVKESTMLGTNSNGSTLRTAESKYTVWEGSLRAVDQFSLYLDYVFIPDLLSNRIALSVYSRSRFNSIQNITNGGLGVYINRKGEPLKIVGGLIYEFEDLFDARDAGTSLDERATLGIIIGYNF